eukprot:2287907-Lingulodinium_polyedra.AAC.1
MRLLSPRPCRPGWPPLGQERSPGVGPARLRLRPSRGRSPCSAQGRGSQGARWRCRSSGRCSARLVRGS